MSAKPGLPRKIRKRGMPKRFSPIVGGKNGKSTSS